MKQKVQSILDTKINQRFDEKKISTKIICDHVELAELLSQTIVYVTINTASKFFNGPGAKEGFISMINSLLSEELGIPGLKAKFKFNNSI